VIGGSHIIASSSRTATIGINTKRHEEMSTTDQRIFVYIELASSNFGFGGNGRHTREKIAEDDRFSAFLQKLSIS
jgi:hypothetical protein